MKMIKFYFFLLFPVIGFSQPVLTNSIIPTFGFQYDAQFIEEPNFNPGPAGENQTWDFSGLQGQLDLHFNILDPANTPETDKFPDASFVWNIEEFESFFYYLSNDEGISQMGTAVANDTETSFLVINSDLEDALQFPVTFGTSYEYHTEYDNYLFGSLIFSGLRDGILTADAYGTLITPYGTYEDVLRLKVITTEFGFSTTQYAWYSESSFIPLLVFESSEDPDEPASLYYTKVDAMVATNDEIDNNAVSVSYSYQSNSIIIKTQMPDRNFENFFLYNINGSLIQKEEAVNIIKEYNEFSFSLKNEVNSGNYILAFTENGVLRSTSLFIVGR